MAVLTEADTCRRFITPALVEAGWDIHQQILEQRSFTDGQVEVAVDVRAATPGGAGRNRTLGQKKLAQIIVPVPPMSEQEKVVEVLNKNDQIWRLAGENSELFVLAASTFLENAFRDADT